MPGVERVPHFFNSDAYLELEAERLGGGALRVTAPQGDLGLIVRPIAGSNSRDAISVYGYPDLDQRPGVAAADTEMALGALRHAAQGHDLVSAYIRIGLTQPFSTPGADPSCRIVHVGDVVAVDLDRSPEAIFAGFRKNLRYELRRAAPMSIEPSDDTAAFHAIYADNMERVGARQEYFFDQDYLARLVRLDGAGLILAHDESGVAAGAIVVEHAGVVFYHLGATAARCLANSPLKSVLWHVCQQYAQRRAMLVLGGGFGGGADSLLSFKRGFSKTMKPVHGLRVVLNEDLYDSLSGPRSEESRLDGYFPAYRTPPVTTAA